MHETNRLAESYTILVLSFAIWSALSSFCGMREHFQNQKEIGEPENAAFSMIILSGGGLAIWLYWYSSHQRYIVNIIAQLTSWDTE